MAEPAAAGDGDTSEAAIERFLEPAASAGDAGDPQAGVFAERLSSAAFPQLPPDGDTACEGTPVDARRSVIDREARPPLAPLALPREPGR
jgi:hypothetical protein